MLSRFFYGGYNATTSIILAVVFNVCLFILSILAGMLFLPFLGWAVFLGYPLIAWGLAAAAKGPNTRDVGTFLCWLLAVVQFGLWVLMIVGMFLPAPTKPQPVKQTPATTQNQSPVTNHQ